jgi:hypothetical protein
MKVNGLFIWTSSKIVLYEKLRFGKSDSIYIFRHEGVSNYWLDKMGILRLKKDIELSSETCGF